ncbi:N-acetyltransferase [Streptomyces puniciscabiei]|uniref:N-acetyltransferase n=1 Tax=Streptomyces puniciscabiei TaxID=164348 RepID=UPI00378E1EBD
MTDLRIATLAERPELAPSLSDFLGERPEFLRHTAAGELWREALGDAFAEYAVFACRADRPDVPVACGASMPVHLVESTATARLAEGWEGVVRAACADRVHRRRPNTVVALGIMVRRSDRGDGLSAAVLTALRNNAARLGFRELLAPVRPSAKHREPATPFADYLARTRPDGLPEDPWLRVHVRAGGVVESVSVRSMVVAGSLAEWRAWTGLPFDRHGPVVVPEALVPVHCDPAQDHAVYVEPNVWVRHVLHADSRTR